MVVAGGVVGALFFLWISGLRVVNPTEINWVMQLDWRIHFLGWHFFRREPWLWPPGRIEGYFQAPDGTAIGFTDSVPLAAFVLKPFSAQLPDPFQYLGLWLLLCFALQGVFGVLLARIWTRDRVLQVLVAALFVLMPTLLIRVGHPALCAHWLLLWSLWLYLRHDAGTREPVLPHAALGFMAGLIHPYMAVMTLALLTALAFKARDGRGLAAALAAVLCAWWAAGLFTVSGSENLVSEGLGYYSMNLLSPVTPSGWSTLLPEQPIGAPGQTFEGFQYLGGGVLFLLVIAVVMWARQNRALDWRYLTPILVVATACAIYALSPRVTVADQVLIDYSSPALERLGIFRATGRFFWPMAYLLVTGATAVVLSTVGGRRATALLVVLVAVQLVDLRGAHAERRKTSRSDTFHSHQLALRSPVWSAAFPHYRHVVLVNPAQCGQAPVGFEWPSYLAGLHGLSINAGEVARPDAAKVVAYCRDLQRQTRAGMVDDDTVYLVSRPLVEPFRAAARVPVICLEPDSVPLCVTTHSYEKWRAAVER